MLWLWKRLFSSAYIFEPLSFIIDSFQKSYLSKIKTYSWKWSQSLKRKLESDVNWFKGLDITQSDPNLTIQCWNQVLLTKQVQIIVKIVRVWLEWLFCYFFTKWKCKWCKEMEIFGGPLENLNFLKKWKSKIVIFRGFRTFFQREETHIIFKFYTR